MLGDSCLRILTRTHLRLTSASMTLRAGGEGMIVSLQSPVGASLSEMIKEDDCEVGGRAHSLPDFSSQKRWYSNVGT